MVTLNQEQADRLTRFLTGMESVSKATGVSVNGFIEIGSAMMNISVSDEGVASAWTSE